MDIQTVPGLSDAATDFRSAANRFDIFTAGLQNHLDAMENRFTQHFERLFAGAEQRLQETIRNELSATEGRLKQFIREEVAHSEIQFASDVDSGLKPLRADVGTVREGIMALRADLVTLGDKVNGLQEQVTDLQEEVRARAIKASDELANVRWSVFQTGERFTALLHNSQLPHGDLPLAPVANFEGVIPRLFPRTTATLLNMTENDLRALLNEYRDDTTGTPEELRARLARRIGILSLSR
jgi:hypothetical protein